MYNSEHKQRQPQPMRGPYKALFDFRVWRCLYSELEMDKSDLSLCNQAVQNSTFYRGSVPHSDSAKSESPDSDRLQTAY